MKNLYESCPNQFETFMRLTGSVNERIKQTTGLANSTVLKRRMAERRDKKAVDILVPSSCSESCITCFFDPAGGPGTIAITPDVVRDIQNTLQQFPDKEFSRCFYPREPSSAMQLLPVYTSIGEKRLLTNGKLLGKENVIDSFLKAGITNIAVTVPGLAESYALYTNEPADTYNQLLDNIRQAAQSGLTIEVFTPVFRQNVNDVNDLVKNLADIGATQIRFIRVLPTGRARDLPDNFFLDKNTTIQFLETVNEVRKKYTGRVGLSLFDGSFGPNFYSPSIYKYLAGQPEVWPGSEYLCPMINRQYIGILLGQNTVVSCFQGMSFEDQTIGLYKDGEVIFTKPKLTANELSNNLRGICAKDACKWQPLCLGGCRVAAFSEAVRRNESNPLFAGQSICVSNIFDKYAN